MSESETPDAATLARELESLERAVGALLKELDSLRGRVADAEDRSGKLERTLEATGVKPGESADLEERLTELTRENAKLKKVIGEAKERADRIRSRLIVMEDESA